MIRFYLAGILVLGASLLVADRIIKFRAAKWFEKIAAEGTAASLAHEEIKATAEYTGALFDCPECNMAAEVATYVTMWDPESGQVITYVVINCPADHDLITVTEDWFVDHVLSKNSD